MSRMRRLLAPLALLALALGVAPAATAQFAGVWRGVGHQSDDGGVRMTWDVQMTIGSGATSRIDYPSIACTGALQELSRSATEIVFRETILTGPCITGGRIVGRLREGRLFWFWELAGSSVEASAVLDRNERIAELKTPATAPWHRQTS